MNVVDLEAAADLPRVGGKAANLARLLAAGAPVPAGFAITSAGLQHFVAEQEAAPPVVAPEVIRRWQRLDAPRVIVRSSALGEDSAGHSFAGQLDSVPNVTSVEALRAAILSVWESQWSDRVRAYQQARGVTLGGMGVVVQWQVDAAVSGVLFTRSPLRASEMLVEYCEGLGEALVSGRVNPGRITILRDRLEWKETDAPDEDAPSAHQLLNDARIRELAECALRLEKTFGAPQDIEWTIGRDGRLWIVQSRPITTGAPEPRRSVLWSNANVNENFPDPISPLLYSIAREGYYHYFRSLGRAFGISGRRLEQMEPALRQIIGVHGARMYYNLTSIHDVLRSAPLGDLLAQSFDHFVGADQDDQQDTVRKTASRPFELVELARIAMRTSRQYAFVGARVAAFERTVDDYAAQTTRAALAAKDTAALVRDLRAFMDIRCNRWTNASLADAGAMVCYGVLKRLLAAAFPGEDQQALHNTLLKALPDLVSGRPPVEIWKLSRLIRGDDRLTDLFRTAPAGEIPTRLGTDDRFRDFRQAVERFQDEWGFRCSGELMLTVPSFQDDPTALFELLKAYAQRDGESPERLLQRQALERERETRRVLRQLRTRLLSRWCPIPQSVAVGAVLRATQRCIQLRERARLKQALLYSRLRKVVLELGARLHTAGLFASRDDVFFLTWEELALLGSGGEMLPHATTQLVELRRRAHGEVAAETPPDSLRLGCGEYLRPASGTVKGERADTSHDGLRGIGACGGSTRARAAILLDVTEAERLRPGDVLVTKQTDPGWGPVFPLISGLVIERGGMLSHGAIIAREFGIPSVVGVKNATRLIAHGQQVVVDGDRGIVRLEAGGA